MKKLWCMHAYEVHLLEGDLISHLWGDSKERLNIPIMNEKNRQTYYGTLNLSKNELIIQGYKTGICQEFQTQQEK